MPIILMFGLAQKTIELGSNLHIQALSWTYLKVFRVLFV